MNNQRVLNPIIDLINQSGPVSESLIRCHNLIAHSIPIDQFDKEIQTDLYDLYETTKALKIVELELIPNENKTIYSLQELLAEKDNRIAELEMQIR